VGKPIAEQEQGDAPERTHSQIQRTQRQENPPAPLSDPMSQCKAQEAQDKVQNQPPKASPADQMIQCTIQQRHQKSEQKSWECHVFSIHFFDCPESIKPTQTPYRAYTQT
jgi:hypothetical protein